MAPSESPALHRRSIRLKGFDYSQRGLYFVTICAYRKRCLFAKVVDGAVHLTNLGHIVQQTWLQIPLHFPQVELQPFVVMPNHIHGVLAIVRSQVKRPQLVGAQHAAPLQDSDSSQPNPAPRVLLGSLSAIVRSFKAAVTKRARIRVCGPDPIWQRNYYERVLRSGKEFGDACRYVIGEPVSVPDAVELGKEDPYQFQWWALGLVGARRTEQRKGSDQGIDGRLYFHDEGANGKTKQIILSVKSGHVSVKDLRDLRGVIDREKAEIGVLITLEDATKPMSTEAASGGFYKSPWGSHPRLQILTVAELLEGKGIDYPHPVNVTFKKAPKAETPLPEQLVLAPAQSKAAQSKPRRKS